MIKLLTLLLLLISQYNTKNDGGASKVANTVKIQSLSYEKSESYEIYQEFEVTAYTAGKESTGKTRKDKDYGITASGVRVQTNHTLACPKSLDFGTQIYIPYFDNTFTCEDRGSAITEGHLDVYMDEYDDAIEFGRRKLAAEIVKD